MGCLFGDSPDSSLSTILEPLNLYYKDINRKEGGGRGQNGHLPAELVLLRKVPNSIMLFKKICHTVCLDCFAQVFSSCREQGLLIVAVHGLLNEVASLVEDHRL